MFRLFAVSLCVLLCGVLLREYNKSAAIALSVGGAVIVFLSVSDKIYKVFSNVLNLTSSIPTANSYIRLMLKVLCIVIIAQFVSDLCRDNGENALASLTELGAKIMVMTLILPLFDSVISLVSGLIK